MYIQFALITSSSTSTFALISSKQRGLRPSPSFDFDFCPNLIEAKRRLRPSLSSSTATRPSPSSSTATITLVFDFGFDPEIDFDPRLRLRPRDFGFDLQREGYDEFENNLRMIVDVRDVAEALLLAYEKPEAEGRYICTAYMIKSQDLVEILKKNYPNYNYPKKFTEGKEEEKLSSKKLQKLGWSYRPIEETLVDSIESCRQAGLLD